MLSGVSSRQSRRDRGKNRGRELGRKLVAELVESRRVAGISQAAVARQLARSQSDISRFERMVNVDSLSLVEICEVAAALGYDVSAGLHPNGDQLRDRGHEALFKRFAEQVGSSWRLAREVPLPGVGDRRSWDVLLRSAVQLVGVELETRIRDIQRLTRRIRERQRDGGADVVLLVLADSAINRRLLSQLVDALGHEFRTSPRAILKALRSADALPGEGVLLI